MSVPPSLTTSSATSRIRTASSSRWADSLLAIALCAAAGLCACGIELQVAPNASSDGGGGGSGGDDDTEGPQSDGATPFVPLCDAAWPLSAPEAVPGIATGQSTGQPRLTADEKDVYFNRSIDGAWHVMHATRAAADEPFQEAIRITSIETEGFEHYWPSISGDGLTLSFSRFNGPVQEILDAHRAATDVDFGALQVVAAGSLLLFRVPDSDEYFYTRYDNGLETIADVTSKSDTSLFPGHVGKDRPLWYEAAARILWFTRDGLQRTSVRSDNGFGEPTDPAEVGASILVTWVSPDGCRLYGSDPEALGTLKMQRRESPP